MRTWVDASAGWSLGNGASGRYTLLWGVQVITFCVPS